MLATRWARLVEQRPRTIRFRIVSLVTLVVVPLMAMFAWLAVSFAAAKRDLIERERLDLTNMLSAAVDRDIAEKLGMLRGLSGSDSIKTNSFEAFARESEIVLQHPHVSQIWVFRQEGTRVAEAARGAADEPRDLDPRLVEKVFQGQNAVSAVQGEGLEAATVVVAVPVFDHEEVVYGLAGKIRLAHLSRIFSDIGMDASWAGAVVDWNGRFIARSLDADKRVGTPARPELGDAARAARPFGIFENTTWEGIEALNAYRRSSLTGWTSIVAVPKAHLAAPVRSAIIYTTLGAGILLLITILAAMTMAARISQPVRSLSNYASSLAEGRAQAAAPLDIIELEEVREALDAAMAKSAHLAAIIASSGDAILSVDLDGRIRTWNSGAEALFGYESREVIGKPKTLIVPKDRVSEFEDQRRRVLKGETVHLETIRLDKSGKPIDVLVNAAPVYGSDGEVIALSSIIHDITALKAAEKHRMILLRELAHRSKNQLAVIQSIAGQTARSAASLDDFLVDFRRRLQGIAVSHDLLSNRNWHGAALAELVRRQLEPFMGDEEHRVSISGPEIEVETAAAEAIGLALHELATNSVKYGALSETEGRIDVRWTLASNGAGAPNVSLEWIETGGPPITQPPTRKGFGSQMIERLVASAVSGRATLEYRPEGVYWRLEYTLPPAA